MQDGEGEEHVSVPAVVSLLSKKHVVAGSNHKKIFFLPPQAQAQQLLPLVSVMFALLMLIPHRVL